ncbi:MAG TPA: putative toxin-antitoxin system toxin component, PIN family [Candidatus Eisenbergiella stercoravium]|nr:putative toxin-antitoxin system toxin component, PIN family [Candidatus Eisenbergiella stercoravium]
MRIMYDTNVLLSSILFPNQRFSQMLEYISQNHRLVLSSFVIEELFAVTKRKFPEKQKVIDRFLTDLSYEYVYTPHQMKSGLFEIRDPNDYPVLYIAVIENIDILITGDKDFTSLIIEKPQILTPSDFISKYM